MKIPENLRYTKEHEWIDPANGKLGITDFAQDQLGDVVYLDFTVAEGDVVEVDQVLGTIESVKTVSDIYAPVSGKVVAMNEAIPDNPEQVNKDPYGEGWLFQIEVVNANEVEELLSSSIYAQQVKP